ncbi:hypothetical protein QYE76_015166 [Lolium multiflorum]|uniref:Uncharacterized protein n=1 Tax=Lolium multiflorum TaxID=4521 RepID=A0AAD8U4D8_LOLMU|nr:hypothetical protein QYE76_015160 [Lolium multiflorum]KAK1698465.1 hypothetical protein QYE76_015162 [Lolium multiflorum]KAK1698467.1 hypothetical protein QYE76_015164 [Lolium multiflorum]KAK1698469.1 hypothetical protein QYE76_015166 [Lolium multiflorum]
MMYDDRHRHPVRVLPGTPLNDWFAQSLGSEEGGKMMVIPHHQGVRRLSEWFIAIAFASDGLVEGFYDLDTVTRTAWASQVHQGAPS